MSSTAAFEFDLDLRDAAAFEFDLDLRDAAAFEFDLDLRDAGPASRSERRPEDAVARTSAWIRTSGGDQGTVWQTDKFGCSLRRPVNTSTEHLRMEG